jgi:DNA-directed RNA polymerase specialized sigma24 family protein
MASDNSITYWIAELRVGNRDAAQRLWERYFDRLVRLASVKLHGGLSRAADGEDVALSAMNSFFQGMVGGRYPQLNDRDDLWRLLVLITARKAYHLIRDEGRQKRGVRQKCATGNIDPEDCQVIDQVVGREPSPDFTTQVAEECQRLYQRLCDPELQEIAQRKMEGYTNGEIAAAMKRALRTIERKLQLIRQIWEQDID